MSYDSHYSITLGQVPIPNPHIACQELLQKKGVGYNGFLRRKRPWRISSIIASMSWDRNYIILDGGCLYMYKNEQQKKPEKAISLFGYTQVVRAGDLRLKKDLSWAFKLVYVLDEKGKVHYFCAPSEAEMKTWMRAMKKGMVEANSINLADDDFNSESDFNDLETPISTNSYFREMRDLENIRKTLGPDSDLDDDEDDEDYTRIDEHISRRPSRSAEGSLSSGGYSRGGPSISSGSAHSPTGSSISQTSFQDFNNRDISPPRGARIKDTTKNRPLPVPPREERGYRRSPSPPPQEWSATSCEYVYDDGCSNYTPENHIKSNISPNDRFNQKGLHVSKALPIPPQPPEKVPPQPPAKVVSKPCLPAVKPKLGQCSGVADRRGGALGEATTDNSREPSALYLPPNPGPGKLKKVAEESFVFNDKNSPPRDLPPVPQSDADSNRFVKLRPVAGGASSASSAPQVPPPTAPKVAMLPPTSCAVKPTIEPSQSKFGSKVLPNPTKSTAVVSPIQQPSVKKPPIVAKKPNAVLDLEAACLFTGDPGEGNRLIMKLDVEGVYMVRFSGTEKLEKTLVFIAECQLRKFKIHQNERKKFSLQKTSTTEFDSIHSLIAYYRVNNLPNRQMKLITPYTELIYSG